jgi:mono/diheme cytochrome c family protein
MVERKTSVMGIMGWIAGSALALLVVATWAGVARAEEGKALFERLGCTKCHAIAAEGVARKPGGKTEGPDLSGKGKTLTADWITSFLEKKVTTEEGKKHKTKFKGTADELKTIAGYIDGLETPAP